MEEQLLEQHTKVSDHNNPDNFPGKNVLIISPNTWGDIHISKHHYAIELARKGKDVFFLEPMVYTAQSKKIYAPLAEFPNLKVISRPVPKYFDLLRFKLRSIYDRLIRIEIKKLLQELGLQLDVVWCFETNLYSDLRLFNGSITIYHPVDPLLYNFQKKIAGTADVVFTVSKTILDSMDGYNSNRHIINHGLNNDFAAMAKARLNDLYNGKVDVSNIKVQVGFVGNLLRPEVNTEFLLTVVEKYPEVRFHFWSPVNIHQSNIAGDDSPATKRLLDVLHQSKNVVLHGVKRSKDLANELINSDILLLPLKKTNKYDCSNSHKLIEYLSTGKVVVANHISTYANSDLLEMIRDDDTAALLQLFDKVVNELAVYDHIDKQIQRIQFALENTYASHVHSIGNLLKHAAKKQ